MFRSADEEEPKEQHMEGVEGIEGKPDSLLCGGILGKCAGLAVVEPKEREGEKGKILRHFPLAGHGGGGGIEEIGDKAQEALMPN